MSSTSFTIGHLPADAWDRNCLLVHAGYFEVLDQALTLHKTGNKRSCRVRYIIGPSMTNLSYEREIRKLYSDAHMPEFSKISRLFLHACI